MNLRRRTMIIIGTIFVASIIGMYTLSQTMLLGSFVKLEENRTALNVERAMSGLSGKLDFLDATALDWAAWDDTYAFVEDSNEGYTKTNLVDDTFGHLGLNLMLFVNSAGQTVFGKAFDLQSERETPLPQDLQGHLSANCILLRNESTESSIKGVILLSGGPMLVASRPILTSEEKGPIRGTLVMGRYLDSAEIDDLAKTTHLSLTVHQFNDPQTPPDFETARPSLSKETPVFIQALNSDTIAGYALLADIYGKPAIVMRVDMPRDIYAQGVATVHYFILYFVVIGLSVGVVAVVFLDRSILSRLSRLSHNVGSIGTSRNTSARVSVAGNDELSKVGDTINKMLTNLELSYSALRESEARFRDIAENALVWIWEVDTDGKYTYTGSAVKNILGYEPEGVLNKHFYDLFCHEDREELKKAAFEAFARKEPFHEFVNRNVHKDGTIVWLSTDGVPMLDEKGDLLGYRGADIDITERKLGGEALMRSEERYRTILEDIEDNYFEVDLAGNLTFVNDSACRSLGYSNEEMMGLSYQAFTVDEQVEPVYRTFNKVYRTGKPVIGFSWEVVRKSGALGFVEASVFPLRNEKGEIVGFRGVGRDVTERKLAEEALRQSEEKYRTILEDMDEVYYEGDLDGNATFFNASTCRVLGYSGQEMVGMNYRVYTAKEDAGAVYNITNKVYQTGEPEKDFCFRIVRKDGSTGFLEASIYPRRNGEGKIAGFRLVGRDVTERKASEQQMLLTSKLASIGELAAGVAHEINNPLTGVIGYAQLLLDANNVPRDVKSDLEKIYQESQRAAKIVQNLLSFARQRKPEKNYLDISELIEKTFDMRSYELKTSNIDLRIDLAPDLPYIMADYHQIQQVVLNVLVNAQQALAEVRRRGKISVATSAGGGYVMVSITDNGPGIPKDIIGRVFNPFFTTKDVGKGTGLGLSVCHGIVTAHGGNMHVESEKGKGATFTIELPITGEGKPMVEEKAVVKESRPRQRKVTGRILIVDDEPGIRESLTRILSGRGYRTDSASDAKTALTKIAEDGYELCIIDLKMPNISGKRLHEIIKRRYPSSAEKVVFITGDTMTPATQDLLDSIGRPYLAKPFTSSEVVSLIEEVLGDGR